MSNADVGQGATLTFPNGWTGEILSMDVPDESVTAHKVTTLADTEERYKAGRVVEGGEVTFAFHVDKGDEFPTVGLTGEFVVTYPLTDGATIPATRTWTGIVTKVGAHKIEGDSIMATAATIKVDGVAAFVEES
jgi:hypothetical protein